LPEVRNGNCGRRLFDDDTACDVRDDFVHLLATAGDPAMATRSLIETWAAAIEDVDEGPVFWLALAATQWKYGCLSADVRSQALDVIDGGSDLARWQGSAHRKRRDTVLRELRERLLSPQPPPRRPRRRKRIEIPSVRVPSPDGRAAAVAFQLGPSPVPGAPRMQVMVEFEMPDGPGGGGVFVADCAWDQVRLSWVDANTLQIEHPASARVADRKEEAFFRGRIIKIRYRAVAAG
jgi:hypothetical protein